MKYREFANIGESIYTAVLSCNMPVCVIPKRGFNKSFAFFATNYGGSDMRFEVSGKWRETPAGVAHFLEHKMFDTKDGNALNILSSRGASVNAFTSNGITAYHFECSENFEDNLKTLLSFVSVPYFTQESVDKEQGIIGQEIGMIEDSPDFRVYNNLMKALYRHNPIRMSVAGSVDSISKITAETLYDCHNTFYNPENMVLCVAGNENPDKIARIAEAILPMRSSALGKRDYGPEEKETPAEIAIQESMEVAQPMFLAGAKVKLPEKGKDRLKAMLVGQLALRIVFGRSSPLYLKAYEDGLPIGPMEYELDAIPGSAYAAFGGSGREPEKFIERYFAYYDEIIDNGVDKKLFDMSKKAMFGAELRSLNSFDNICYEQAIGTFNGYCPFDTFSEIESITDDDVNSFIKKWLPKESIAVSVIKR